MGRMAPLFNNAVRPGDPRLKVGSYIKSSTRLCEVLKRQAVDVLVEDVRTGVTFTISDNLLIHWTLVREMQTEAPDYPPDLEEART